jgi:hypothetical protein
MSTGGTTQKNRNYLFTYSYGFLFNLWQHIGNKTLNKSTYLV